MAVVQVVVSVVAATVAASGAAADAPAVVASERNAYMSNSEAESSISYSSPSSFPSSASSQRPVVPAAVLVAVVVEPRSWSLEAPSPDSGSDVSWPLLSSSLDSESD